jgi:anti-sigma-K factor RskA
VATYDDEEHEALAAEYVLGTLSAEEREHAEALRTFDPGFEAAVLQWERRLGELNVMVEAVEPQPELWEKIKGGIAAGETPTAPEVSPPRDLDSPAVAAALASDLIPSELVTPHLEEPGDQIAAEHLPGEIPAPAEIPPPPPSIAVPEPPTIERSADVIYLARRVRRWRGMTLTFGAIAALLALYVALTQAAPDLIPAQLRRQTASIVPPSEAPARMQQDRLVAVLQQDPTAPAFLVTLDTQRRTLFVRRVSATLEAGKSYELWLISKRLAGPHSLGIVGSDEFTQRELPAKYDADTLRGASYAVSLEPAGGSPTGLPTGPVLFTGKAVESLPSSPPPKPATPKT